jgi:uncharacterized protein HemX
MPARAAAAARLAGLRPRLWGAAVRRVERPVYTSGPAGAAAWRTRGLSTTASEGAPHAQASSPPRARSDIEEWSRPVLALVALFGAAAAAVEYVVFKTSHVEKQVAERTAALAERLATLQEHVAGVEGKLEAIVEGVEGKLEAKVDAKLEGSAKETDAKLAGMKELVAEKTSRRGWLA